MNDISNKKLAEHFYYTIVGVPVWLDGGGVVVFFIR